MRKKLLMLTTALVVLAGGLIEVSPKSAAAAGCRYPGCASARIACYQACNGDIDCRNACYDDYLVCCLI